MSIWIVTHREVTSKSKTVCGFIQTVNLVPPIQTKFNFRDEEHEWGENAWNINNTVASSSLYVGVT